MNEKNMDNNNFKLTVRNAIRILSVICVIITFCPTFLVSCSGQEVKISSMAAVSGLKSYGSTVGKGHPILLITLLLPVAIIIVLSMNSIIEKNATIAALACAGADFGVWLIFRSAVKQAADENYCQFKSTGWFVLCIFSLIMIIIGSILVLKQKLEMETNIIEYFSNGDSTRKAINQMSSAVVRMSDKVSKMAGDISANTAPVNKETAIRQCAKCGTPIKPGSGFCMKCGAPVPKEVPETDLNEKVLFCPKCGKKQEPGAVFCVSCGYRLNNMD